MNAKSVLTLAAGALVVAALAWWLNQPQSSDTESTDVALYPALSADLNAISKVRVSDAQGRTVTVMAEDDMWRVVEKNNYFADAGKVRALVLALGNARVIEEKTGNPEFYERLGVRDVTEKESAAILLELTHATDIPALLVGNSSPRAGGASLVRRSDESMALLVAPAIDVDTEINAWLDTRVLDIGPDDIQSIVIQDGKDQRVEIRKAAMFDKGFTLTGLDEDQTPDTVKVNSLSRSLAGLKFEDVIRSVAFAIGDYSFTDVTCTLFSGVIIDAKLFYPQDPERENKQYWFAATARFDQNIAQDFVPQPAGAEDGGANTDSGEGLTEASAKPEPVRLTAADMADRRERADAINARLKGWIYRISESRYNNLSYSAAEMIKE